MIIYGTKAVHLLSEQSKNAICPSCNTKGSIVYSVYGRHAHIFWVPTFPIGKVGASECQHCKNVIKSADMPTDLKTEYKDLKSVSRAPLWQFSGLVVLVAFAVWIGFSSSKNKDLEKGYIQEPVSGDVYKIKTEDKQYTAIKVAAVTADSVYLRTNQYQTNKLTGVSKIDIDENYAADVYALSRGKIQELYDSGEIISVKR